jgi:hypothetical protein
VGLVQAYLEWVFGGVASLLLQYLANVTARANCAPEVQPHLDGLLFNVADTQRFDYVPSSRLFPRFQNL